MEIKTLVAKAHENAVKHGFWEPPLPFGTAIALIHSELSEALEEERNGNPDVWFACNESGGSNSHHKTSISSRYVRQRKPLQVQKQKARRRGRRTG